MILQEPQVFFFFFLSYPLSQIDYLYCSPSYIKEKFQTGALKEQNNTCKNLSKIYMLIPQLHFINY